MIIRKRSLRRDHHEFFMRNQKEHGSVTVISISEYKIHSQDVTYITTIVKDTQSLLGEKVFNVLLPLLYYHI